MSKATCSEKEVSDSSKLPEDPPISKRPYMKKTFYEGLMTPPLVDRSTSSNDSETTSELDNALFGDFNEEDHIEQFDGNSKHTSEVTTTHTAVSETSQTRDKPPHKGKTKGKQTPQEAMQTGTHNVIEKENGSSSSSGKSITSALANLPSAQPSKRTPRKCSTPFAESPIHEQNSNDSVSSSVSMGRQDDFSDPVAEQFLSILFELTSSTVNIDTHWVPLPDESGYYQLLCQYFGSTNVSSSNFEEICTAIQDPKNKKDPMAIFQDLLLDHLGSDSRLLLRTINEVDKIIKRKQQLEQKAKKAPEWIKTGIASINKATQSMIEATQKLYNNPTRADSFIAQLHQIKIDIIEGVHINRVEKSEKFATLDLIKNQLREKVAAFVNKNRKTHNYEQRLNYFIAFFDTWIYLKIKNPKGLDDLPTFEDKRKAASDDDPITTRIVKKIKPTPVAPTMASGTDLERDTLIQEFENMKKRVDEILGMKREQIIPQVRPMEAIRPTIRKRFDPFPDYGFNPRYRGTIVYKLFHLYRLIHFPDRSWTRTTRRNRMGSHRLPLNKLDRNIIKKGSLTKISEHFNITFKEDLIPLLNFIQTSTDKINDVFHKLTNFKCFASVHVIPPSSHNLTTLQLDATHLSLIGYGSSFISKPPSLTESDLIEVTENFVHRAAIKVFMNGGTTRRILPWKKDNRSFESVSAELEQYKAQIRNVIDPGMLTDTVIKGETTH